MMRFALFGAGRAGTIHANNIAAHPAAELRYIFDVDQAAAQRLAARLGARCPQRQEEVWQADDVDAVLIASSTDTHADLLRQAMRAGKPTYCEKPIDLDIDKVSAVVAEASAYDVSVFVGFRRRFASEFQQMRRRIQEGAVGRVESVRIVARDFEPAALAYLERSGGLLRDKMVHYFDLVPWMVSERPAEVYAAGSCLIDPANVPAGDVDTAVVLLRFPSGALCTIENARRSVYGCDDRIEVFGSEGLLQSSPAPSHPLVHFTRTGIVQGGFSQSYSEESFANALDAFIRAVGSGAVVSPSLQDGYRAQLIAEAAVESLRINRPVQLQREP